MIIHKQLKSGKMVNMVDPQVSDIQLEDVLEPLAYMPRFDCHTHSPIYVLHHSLAVADVVQNPESVPYALVHDFEEAFTGDIGTPVKQALAYIGGPATEEALKKLSRDWTRVTHIASGLDTAPPQWIIDDVKQADIVALVTERYVMNVPTEPWHPTIEAVDRRPDLEHYYDLSPAEAVKKMTDMLYRFCPTVPRKDLSCW